jgi:hypothetical protein
VLGVVVLTAATAAAAYLTPPKSGIVEHIAYPVVAGVLATLFVVSGLYAFFWLRGPVLQRDQLKMELANRPEADAVDRARAEKDAQKKEELAAKDAQVQEWLLENNRATALATTTLQLEKDEIRQERDGYRGETITQKEQIRILEQRLRDAESEPVAPEHAAELRKTAETIHKYGAAGDSTVFPGPTIAHGRAYASSFYFHFPVIRGRLADWDAAVEKVKVARQALRDAVYAKLSAAGFIEPDYYSSPLLQCVDIFVEQFHADPDPSRRVFAPHWEVVGSTLVVGSWGLANVDGLEAPEIEVRQQAIANFVATLWELPELESLDSAVESRAAVWELVLPELVQIEMPGTIIQRRGGCGRC